jgi:hypothetical protein
MDFKALSLELIQELSDPISNKAYVHAKLRACIEEDAPTLFRLINEEASRITAEKDAAIARVKADRDTVVARLTDEVARYALELQKKKDEYKDAIAQITAEFTKVVEEANKYITSNNALIDTNANMMAQIAHLKSVTPLSYEERIDLATVRADLEVWKAIAEQREADNKRLAADNYMLKQMI